MASYGIGPKYTLREGTRSAVNLAQLLHKKACVLLLDMATL